MLPRVRIFFRLPAPVRRRFVLAALLLLAGCANPVPPTGGPRDETPPRIASSQPVAEATNVSGRTVQILFSEYVDRESLREALSVTPRYEGRLDFDWHRRSVEITFPEPFRDSTTYVLTIDKALQDVRGVSLTSPLTLAFSTGAQIDRGRLSGRVIGNDRGAGREGFDVYAYAAPYADSTHLPDAPLYRTQTGPDGAFQLDYLREDLRYYVVALQDRNRNWVRDPLEAFAVPPRPVLVPTVGDTTAAPTRPADTTRRAALPDTSRAGRAARPSEPWVAAQEDPVSPRLTRALPLSDRRLALRFSEPIRLQMRRPGGIALIDTTTGRTVPVRSIYQRPGQAQRITLRTAPLRPTGHRVRLVDGPPPLVTDTSGNAPERPAAAAFTAPERPDTLGLRFLGFEKSGPALPVAGEGDTLLLAPGQAPAVQFNQPPDSARLLVTARAPSGDAALPFRLETDDGTTYRLVFDPPLAPGQAIRLQVDGRRLQPPADTVYTRLVRRLPGEALGAVSGAVQIVRGTQAPDDSLATPPVLVELYPAEGDSASPLRTTPADSSGRFIFRGLPEGAYRFRAFLDRDTDHQWDAGRLAPYRPAEPLAWSRQPVEARPRWETATEDTLRIDALHAATSD